jgi:hypothetical protein
VFVTRIRPIVLDESQVLAYIGLLRKQHRTAITHLDHCKSLQIVAESTLLAFD